MNFWLFPRLIALLLKHCFIIVAVLLSLIFPNHTYILAFFIFVLSITFFFLLLSHCYNSRTNTFKAHSLCFCVWITHLHICPSNCPNILKFFLTISAFFPIDRQKSRQKGLWKFHKKKKIIAVVTQKQVTNSKQYRN